MESEGESGVMTNTLLLFVLAELGSPAILGEKDEDGEDGASDVNYPSDNQNQKQKIAERMLSWQMTYGRGDPNYDKEVSHTNIPLLTNGTEVSGELSAASPGRFSMASPGAGITKSKHQKKGMLSSCFGGSRKKSPKSSKKGSDKKKSSKHADPTVPVFNLEDIEEGVEDTMDPGSYVAAAGENGNN
ncbi:hypothetical protein QQ045_016302 [Rhodiola kirilowii]